MRFGLLGSASRIAVLLVICPGLALAQSDPAQAPSGDEILVICDRPMVDALRRIAAEREYGEREVGEYGAPTVGEFVDEVRSELRDDEIIFLINGEPVTGIDDVADFPAEAVERLE